MHWWNCDEGEDAVLEQEMKRTLKDLGIRPGIKGYWYICDALQMLCGKPLYTVRIAEVYRAVAKIYGITDKVVSRNIRTALLRMPAYADSKKMYEIFGNTHHLACRNMKNKEFLWTLAEYLSDKDAV